MAGEPDPTTPGARFPYAAAAFCAACVAAAVWTFMLYSCASPIRPSELRGTAIPEMHPLLGRYVRLLPGIDRAGWGFARIEAMTPARDVRDDHYVAVYQGNGLTEPVSGRVVDRMAPTSTFYTFLAVDARASRWNGASVAGLVVGAMGAFIFALHLRRWLLVRRLAAEAGTVFTAEVAEDAERDEDGGHG